MTGDELPEVVQQAEAAYEAVRRINHIAGGSMPAPLVYQVLGNLKMLGHTCRRRCGSSATAWSPRWTSTTSTRTTAATRPPAWRPHRTTWSAQPSWRHRSAGTSNALRAPSAGRGYRTAEDDQ